MKRNNIIGYLIAFFCLLVAACEDSGLLEKEGSSVIPDNPVQPTYTLEVDPTELKDIKAEGETTPITVKSNDSWTATASDSWITLSTPNGTNNETIDVTIAANEDTSYRSGSITFEGSNSRTETVTISQQGKSPSSVDKDYYIKVIDPESNSESTSWYPGSSATSREFEVKSNDEWEVNVEHSTATWLSVTKNSDSKFTANVTNNGTTPREATIKLTGTHGTTATIAVTQSAEGVYMKIDGYDKDKAISIDADATSVSFSVESNVGWTVSETDGDGIITGYNSKSGNANEPETITVTLKENTKTTPVSATIKVEGNNGEITRQITITQKGKVYELDANPSPNENLTNVSADGTTTITFDVTSNDSWTVTGNPNWINIDPTSGTGNGFFEATISPNTGTDSRSATIKVTANHDSSKEKTFEITQQGKTPDSVISIGEDYGKDKELSRKRQ